MVYVLLLGWPIFWILPFAGGLIRDQVRRNYGETAGALLNLFIVVAWVLMLITVPIR